MKTRIENDNPESLADLERESIFIQSGNHQILCRQFNVCSRLSCEHLQNNIKNEEIYMGVLCQYVDRHKQCA